MNDIENIPLERFNEDELADLNQRIVARLKLLDSEHTQREMMRFSVGESVGFEPPGKGPQRGILVKYNKKTVTVIAEGGRRWNVSPHLLYRDTETKAQAVSKPWQHQTGTGSVSNVIALKARK
jgi:hypothetical protein